MPETKEEMYGLLAEFDEKVNFMIENVLSKHNDFWDEMSDKENELIMHYQINLIHMRALYYELDHELSNQVKSGES